MVKKLVNGQVKDLTDVTVGGIKVYSCAKQEINHDRSYNSIDDGGDSNRSDNKSDDTSNAKNDSTLGAMSLFS